MVRSHRPDYPDTMHHVTGRGVARREIYEDDRDRESFLWFLGREVVRQEWRCFAYCLMGNHYHVLIHRGGRSLARGMQRLVGGYAAEFNARHGRSGHLFQGRYHSTLVEDDEHLQELCRYIVLNPVRAGLVEAAEEWRWSSHRATLGLAASPSWLESGWLLGRFGVGLEGARKAYNEFVRAGSRSSANRSITAQEILRDVRQGFGLGAGDPLGKGDGGALETSAYLLRVVGGLSLRQAGELLGISHSLVAGLQRRVQSAGLSSRGGELLRRYRPGTPRMRRDAVREASAPWGRPEPPDAPPPPRPALLPDPLYDGVRP